MRKISRKGLVRKLDAIVKEIVILRDKHCVTCGTTQNLTPGHLFSRVAYSTRWDLNNVFCQCAAENLRHEYDPYTFTTYFLNKFGQDAYDQLHRQYVTPRKFKDFQLQELYEELSNTLSELKKTI